MCLWQRKCRQWVFALSVAVPSQNGRKDFSVPKENAISLYGKQPLLREHRKSLTSAVAQKLLSNGEVKLKGCKSAKTGRMYDATVVMTVTEEGKPQFNMNFENGGKVMMNEFNPDGKDIRFIDSHYRDLFRIPDGGTIQVHYSDDSVVIKPCKFIDEYHTQIGNNVFHICQFAELLERNGSYCQAEPEIMGDEAAWQVGRDQYLAIQTCEDGYDYTLFDKEFHEIDGGQLDNPELSMLEARAEILAGFGLQMRELRVQVYEEVMEKQRLLKL